jgi:hypothetical protein
MMQTLLLKVVAVVIEWGLESRVVGSLCQAGVV